MLSPKYLAKYLFLGENAWYNKNEIINYCFICTLEKGQYKSMLGPPIQLKPWKASVRRRTALGFRRIESAPSLSTFHYNTRVLGSFKPRAPIRLHLHAHHLQQSTIHELLRCFKSAYGLQAITTLVTMSLFFTSYRIHSFARNVFNRWKYRHV